MDLPKLAVMMWYKVVSISSSLILLPCPPTLLHTPNPCSLLNLLSDPIASSFTTVEGAGWGVTHPEHPSPLQYRELSSRPTTLPPPKEPVAARTQVVLLQVCCCTDCWADDVAGLTGNA